MGLPGGWDEHQEDSEASGGHRERDRGQDRSEMRAG